MMGPIGGQRIQSQGHRLHRIQVKRLRLQPAGDSGGYFQTCRSSSASSKRAPGYPSMHGAASVGPISCRAIPARRSAASTRTGGSMPACSATERTLTGGTGGREVHRDRRPARSPNLPPSAQVNRGALLAKYRGSGGTRSRRSRPSHRRRSIFFRRPQTILHDGPRDTTSLPVYVYVNAAGARLVAGAALDSVRAGAVGRPCTDPCHFRSRTPTPARNYGAISTG